MMKFGWILTSAFILVGIISLPARAQVIPGRWEKALDLAAGQPIHVNLKNGDWIEGKFEGLSSSGLSLRTNSARAVIPRADIERITTREADSRRNGTLIGAGVGAGIIVIWAATLPPASDPLFPIALIYTAIAAGAGAGIGLAVDASIEKEDVYYQAP